MSVCHAELKGYLRNVHKSLETGQLPRGLHHFTGIMRILTTWNGNGTFISGSRCVMKAALLSLRMYRWRLSSPDSFRCCTTSSRRVFVTLKPVMCGRAATELRDRTKQIVREKAIVAVLRTPPLFIVRVTPERKKTWSVRGETVSCLESAATTRKNESEM